MGDDTILILFNEKTKARNLLPSPFCRYYGVTSYIRSNLRPHHLIGHVPSEELSKVSQVISAPQTRSWWDFYYAYIRRGDKQSPLRVIKTG